MTKPLLTALAALLLSSACTRSTPAPSLSDDDRAELLSNQVEELRARTQAENPGCPAWKELSRKACGLSNELCQLAGKRPERLDFQKRCTQAQEDCARFSDQGGRCP
jgi:hypothetical protein